MANEEIREDSRQQQQHWHCRRVEEEGTTLDDAGEDQQVKKTWKIVRPGHIRNRTSRLGKRLHFLRHLGPLRRTQAKASCSAYIPRQWNNMLINALHSSIIFFPFLTLIYPFRFPGMHRHVVVYMRSARSFGLRSMMRRGGLAGVNDVPAEHRRPSSRDATDAHQDTRRCATSPAFFISPIDKQAVSSRFRI